MIIKLIKERIEELERIIDKIDHRRHKDGSSKLRLRHEFTIETLRLNERVLERFSKNYT